MAEKRNLVVKLDRWIRVPRSGDLWWQQALSFRVTLFEEYLIYYLMARIKCKKVDIVREVLGDYNDFCELHDPTLVRRLNDIQREINASARTRVLAKGMKRILKDIARRQLRLHLFETGDPVGACTPGRNWLRSCVMRH